MLVIVNCCLVSTSEEIQTEKLYELLSSEESLWQVSDDGDHLSDYCDEEFENDYGFNYADIDDCGQKIYKSVLNKFVPVDLSTLLKMPEFIEDFEFLNHKMQELYTQYVTFAEDILRFLHLYKDFVDNFLHSQHKFLDSDSLANIFIEFIQKTNKNQDYLKFSSGFSKFSHSVIKKGDKNILCETYEFKSLGAFLYFDLFRSIENNYIPKKCENCGTYFLIKSGKYTDYCENISPNDAEKTCKDVGFRKKYDLKCKTDPIWQTYNRAYKAHYARYMKKKMSISEFEKWSTWAISWRTKAENDEISIDEYVLEIKK